MNQKIFHCLALSSGLALFGCSRVDQKTAGPEEPGESSHLSEPQEINDLKGSTPIVSSAPPQAAALTKTGEKATIEATAPEKELPEPEEKKRMLIRGLKGKQAIYRESVLLAHILIEEVKVDDWGVTLQVSFLEHYGQPYNKTGTQLSCAWSALTSDGQSLWAMYVNWSVVHDPSIVEQVLKVASSHPDGASKKSAIIEAMRNRL